MQKASFSGLFDRWARRVSNLRPLACEKNPTWADLADARPSRLAPATCAPWVPTARGLPAASAPGLCAALVVAGGRRAGGFLVEDAPALHELSAGTRGETLEGAP